MRAFFRIGFEQSTEVDNRVYLTGARKSTRLSHAEALAKDVDWTIKAKPPTTASAAASARDFLGAMGLGGFDSDDGGDFGFDSDDDPDDY